MTSPRSIVVTFTNLLNGDSEAVKVTVKRENYEQGTIADLMKILSTKLEIPPNRVQIFRDPHGTNCRTIILAFFRAWSCAFGESQVFFSTVWFDPTRLQDIVR